MVVEAHPTTSGRSFKSLMRATEIDTRLLSMVVAGVVAGMVEPALAEPGAS